jgi:hypothetical protein
MFASTSLPLAVSSFCDSAIDIVPEQHSSREETRAIQHYSVQLGPRGVKTIPARPTMPCPICLEPYEEAEEDLKVHLHRHLDSIKSSTTCSDCNSGLVHGKPLDLRQTIARSDQASSRVVNDIVEISSHDNARRCKQLQDYGECQLKEQIESIQLLTALRDARPAEDATWSVDGHEQGGISAEPDLRAPSIAPTHNSAPSNELIIGGEGIRSLRTPLSRIQRDSTINLWLHHRHDRLLYFIAFGGYKSR